MGNNNTRLLRYMFAGITFGVAVAILYIIIGQIRDDYHLKLSYKASPSSSVENEVLNLDNTNFTEELIKSRIEKTNQNVLIAHLNDVGPMINWTCAQYVSALNIQFNNIYWQVQINTNETFYLYGAYLDKRSLANGTVIRIVGMVDKLDPPDVYCQFWFNKEPKPIISKVFHKQYMWLKEWGFQNAPLQPYVWSCQVPENFKTRVPESVSLVENPCQHPRNNLRVINNLPKSGKKENFAVCVKQLNFQHRPDIAFRLVEWIELLKILGANKIIFYELTMHANISKVLDYYSNTWNVEVIKTTLPGHYSNIPDLMGTYLYNRLHIQIFQEMIQYNDCFYKNFNKFRYIVLMDIDEVILPLRVKTWSELIFNITLPKARRVKNGTNISFVARNVHFMDDRKEYKDWLPGIPRYMHMLHHVLRNSEHMPPGSGIKVFHNSEIILSLHNHYPRGCLLDGGRWCEHFDFDLKDAHLQHYCVGRGKFECSTKREGNLTLDMSILRYRQELVEAVRDTLKRTGFLN
ncbi:uncharacterized protein LOC132195342 isoform X1 [Neocloeon triangulifer]|uniref:uncharacterized protein LOC132195342 isoform X1 n=2 Tax=Neocloeon triangulifer TaxID=2078957 RepID=UPI00286F3F6C|nr:uncharacterized protein LOC132195342 isoform X1 [Neocloeon triangulifer]XP_059473264.1 uncharacterized protein LOC132195342 isoform X1 [Neocloeon triangulifer]